MSRSGRRGRSPSSAWTVASAAASIARPLGAGRSPARANAPPRFLLPVDIERVLRRAERDSLASWSERRGAASVYRKHWQADCVGSPGRPTGTGRYRAGDEEGRRVSYARISVCGVVEYPCAGTCGDWIREHEAIWVLESGKVGVTGEQPYCPACADAARGTAAPTARSEEHTSELQSRENLVCRIMHEY